MEVEWEGRFQQKHTSEGGEDPSFLVYARPQGHTALERGNSKSFARPRHDQKRIRTRIGVVGMLRCGGVIIHVVLRRWPPWGRSRLARKHEKGRGQRVHSQKLASWCPHLGHTIRRMLQAVILVGARGSALWGAAAEDTRVV